MRKVLVVHPWIRPLGGAHAVAAWTLQALRETADLTLLVWETPDLAQVNRYYGTTLQAGDFRVELPCPMACRVIDLVPGPSHLLRLSLLLRCCRQLDRRQAYDVLLSTFNEADLGRRGIQYIHAPKTLAASDDARPRYHPSRLGLAAYQRASAAIAGAPSAGIEANLTLVNSEFIAEQVRAIYGIASIVLHPPVPGGFPDIPWHERIDGFVLVNRFHPTKRLVEVIEIVECLRALGHDLRLTVVGTPNDRDYEAKIRGFAESRAEWLTLHVSVPRRDLVELVARHRYAIHAMAGEHFGIVVAEYLKAGCIPFVHASGGPPDIVGGDARLTFTDTERAVANIDRVLRAPELQKELRDALRARRDLYSEARFMDEIRGVISRFPNRA